MGISTQQYSLIVGAFPIGYTIMQPVCGLIVDLIGIRLGFAPFAGRWSVGGCLQGGVTGWLSLAGARGLMGLTEAAAILAGMMEGVAKPGAICLSEDAYRQVQQRLDLKVSDLGPTVLENIAQPVRVYSLEVRQPAERKPKAPTSRPRWDSATLAAAIASLLLLVAGSGWNLPAVFDGLRKAELPED